MEIICRAVWSIFCRQIIRSLDRLMPNEMTLSHFELATKSCGCVWRRTHVFLPSTRHLNCNKLKRYYVRAATATIKWMYLRLLPGRYRRQRKRNDYRYYYSCCRCAWICKCKRSHKPEGATQTENNIKWNKLLPSGAPRALSLVRLCFAMYF